MSNNNNSKPCTMDIFFASDDRYAQPLCVLITSILVNSLPCENFNFYVLDGGISEKNKKQIASVLSSHDNIEFITVDDSLFADCPITPGCRHISKQTYYRYIIPQIKPHLERVLYLDCDIIVDGNLNELWHTDFEGNLAIAVEEFYMEAHKNYCEMGIPKSFNAGVLLINNAAWVNEDVTAKLFENTALLYDKIKWVDQDVLNFTLNHRVKFVHPKYNLLPTAYFCCQHSLYSDSEMDEARREPIIIHYSWSSKPWQKRCIHPLWRRYFKYLKLSSFKKNYYRHKIATAIEHFLHFPSYALAHYHSKVSTKRYKALIFGSGIIGRHLLPMVQAKYDVLAFVDNNEAKWGSEIENTPIISPKAIKESGYDTIIIATNYGFDDVKAQLREMGVKRWKIIDMQQILEDEGMWK